MQLACTLGLEKIIGIGIDDSLRVKDAATMQLEGGQLASRPQCQQQETGGLQKWLCLPGGQRLKFCSRYRLAREMLEEIAPVLPADFQVYVLFDSWYSSAKLIKYCRRQDWYVTAGLKSNHCLDGKKLSQWHKDLQHTRCGRVKLAAADGSQRTYFVRTRRGRLNNVPFEACVFISKQHPRNKKPAYFLYTDLSLLA